LVAPDPGHEVWRLWGAGMLLSNTISDVLPVGDFLRRI